MPLDILKLSGSLTHANPAVQGIRCLVEDGVQYGIGLVFSGAF
jgi:hypothetical protein